MAPAYPAAVEASRFLLAYLDSEDGQSFDLSGDAAVCVTALLIAALQELAARDGLTGGEQDEYVRRFLTHQLEFHTLAALEAELAAPGG